MMRARSTLDWSQSNNISCYIIKFTMLCCSCNNKMLRYTHCTLQAFVGGYNLFLAVTRISVHVFVFIKIYF